MPRHPQSSKFLDLCAQNTPNAQKTRSPDLDIIDSTLHPKPEPETLSPKPCTLNPKL